MAQPINVRMPKGIKYSAWYRRLKYVRCVMLSQDRVRAWTSRLRLISVQWYDIGLCSSCVEHDLISVLWFNQNRSCSISVIVDYYCIPHFIGRFSITMYSSNILLYCNIHWCKNAFEFLWGWSLYLPFWTNWLRIPGMHSQCVVVYSNIFSFPRLQDMTHAYKRAQ